MKLKLLCLLLAFIIFKLGCASSIKKRPAENIRTWKEMREQNVIMQQFDFSCGAGSLATLMNYYFQDNVTEKQLIKDIFELLPEDVKNNRREHGLSLLDLKRLAEHRGYLAYGVNLQPYSLFKIDRPVIVYLETADYKHFAVFRGVKENRVFLADSSRGNIRMPMNRFLGEWKGRMALALDKKDFKPPKKHLLSLNEDFSRAELLTARNSLFFKP